MTKVSFTEKIKNPIIGASVQAFGRIGIEKIFPSFKIVCLNYSAEIEYLRKDNIPVFCLEETVGHLSPSTKRNPFSALKNTKAQQFIQKPTSQHPPVVLLYKSSPPLEALARKNGWILAANPFSLEKKLEDKSFFSQILKEASVPSILKKTLPLKTIKQQGYQKLSKTFSSKMVIQDPQRGGGGGTFFVKKEKDFQKTIKALCQDLSLKSPVVVSVFIEGFSPSITGCVTKKGTFQIPPQIQLIDIKELFSKEKGQGVFCGHDWSEAHKIKKEIYQKMRQAITKIGLVLQKKGFKGIFGIDFIVDWPQKNVFPLELNPRLLGTFPVSTLIQLQEKEFPLIGIHILEFLNKTSLIATLQSFTENQNQRPRKGAHFFIRAPYRPAQINQGLKPGIYCLNKNILCFIRKGYSLTQIKKPTEFLIIDGVPSAAKKIKAQDPGRLFRVVFSCQISQNMGTELNQFGSRVVKAIYQTLNITHSCQKKHGSQKSQKRSGS